MESFKNEKFVSIYLKNNLNQKLKFIDFLKFC